MHKTPMVYSSKERWTRESVKKHAYMKKKFDSLPSRPWQTLSMTKHFSINTTPYSVLGTTMATLAIKYSKDSSHLYLEKWSVTLLLAQSYLVDVTSTEEFSAALVSLTCTTLVPKDDIFFYWPTNPSKTLIVNS